MYSAYQVDKSLYAVSARFGFTPTGIRSAFKRAGLHVQTPKEAGPTQGAKRRGINHFSYGKPRKPLKYNQYRMQWITDSDGKRRKRRTHVIVMENFLGRRLFSHECVHHINGDRDDNRIENLQIMTRSEHASLELTRVRAKNPDAFKNWPRGEDGRYLPQPSRPHSRYNLDSAHGKAKRNKGLL